MLDVCANSLSPSNGNSSSKTINGDNKLHITAVEIVSNNNQDPTYSAYVPLVDKIQRYINARHDVPFFSVEFFPPRNDKSASTFIQLLDKFREGDPYFCDITWHAAGMPGLESPTSSITIAGVSLNYSCLDTMLHVTCIGTTKADLRQHLERAKRLGIRSILALRGDKHG